METNEELKEFLIIIVTSLILSICFIYPTINDSYKFFIFFLGFFIVILINVLTKKIIAYNLEIDIETKFWSVYYFGLKEKKHFKYPLPMVWLPFFVSILTNGFLQWFPILEFEEKARIERVARRHELYRFSNVTEWHSGLIAFYGLLANLILFFILVYLNFFDVAKISLYYAIWSLIPISRLDGSKILFGSRKLWVLACILCLISLIFYTMFL